MLYCYRNLKGIENLTEKIKSKEYFLLKTKTIKFQLIFSRKEHRFKDILSKTIDLNYKRNKGIEIDGKRKFSVQIAKDYHPILLLIGC